MTKPLEVRVEVCMHVCLFTWRLRFICELLITELNLVGDDIGVPGTQIPNGRVGHMPTDVRYRHETF